MALPLARDIPITSSAFDWAAWEDQAINATAGELPRRALRLALEAQACAVRQGLLERPATLTVVDYTKPSTERRLWTLDLATGQVLLAEWVKHGQGSGQLHATAFSNTPESHQSSLGLMDPLFRYEASSGPAMRLAGLEEGVNDLVYDRAIIVHQGQGVGPGMRGRSQGCLVMRPEVMPIALDALDRGALFSYHAEASEAVNSPLLGCGAVLSPLERACPVEERTSPTLATFNRGV